MISDAAFLEKFENASWQPEDWHHREHIKVAYLYLCRFPFETAVERVRAGIQKLNAAHKTPEELTRGYHETMTQAWMRLVYATLSEFGPADTADQFLDQQPQLLSKRALLFFYSRDRIMSAEAKYGFVEPDLASFPVSPNAFSPPVGKLGSLDVH